MNMKYLFRPDELKEGVSGKVCGLDFLSCKRIELDSDNPAVTVETGTEEVVLVCMAGQVDVIAIPTFFTSGFWTWTKIRPSIRFSDLPKTTAYAMSTCTLTTSSTPRAC
jgi:hypothetical protein